MRDRALGLYGDVPKSETNREFYAQNMERQLQTGALAVLPGLGLSVNAVGPVPLASLPAGAVVGAGADASAAVTAGAGAPPGGKAPPDGRPMLERLARRSPYYQRNAPKICSFFVKGECKRGDACPYRHEMPRDPSDPLAHQNIRDRYHGTDDPLAEKILRKASAVRRLQPPADTSITTLFVSDVDAADITEQDLRGYFYQFGELRSIHIVPRQSCAFVAFATRAGAEAAAACDAMPIVKNHRLRLAWGRGAVGAAPGPAALPLSAAAPGIHYPSQDPHRLGAD